MSKDNEKLGRQLAERMAEINSHLGSFVKSVIVGPPFRDVRVVPELFDEAADMARSWCNAELHGDEQPLVRKVREPYVGGWVKQMRISSPASKDAQHIDRMDAANDALIAERDKAVSDLNAMKVAAAALADACAKLTYGDMRDSPTHLAIYKAWSPLWDLLGGDNRSV